MMTSIESLPAENSRRQPASAPSTTSVAASRRIGSDVVRPVVRGPGVRAPHQIEGFHFPEVDRMTLALEGDVPFGQRRSVLLDGWIEMIHGPAPDLRFRVFQNRVAVHDVSDQRVSKNQHLHPDPLLSVVGPGPG